MRYMDDAFDGTHSNQVVTVSGYTRICIGDSGGPYFYPGTSWTYALQSTADHIYHGCSTQGGKVRGMRFTTSKARTINGWRAIHGLPLCTVVPGYSDYWQCP